MDFRTWARQYRADAAADNYELARADWDHVSLEGEREPIQKRFAQARVRDTIKLVARVLSMKKMDGQSGGERFLALQTYDPSRSAARYRLTFELGMYRRTQLLVEEMTDVDLVDLHSAITFLVLQVDRCDGAPMSDAETDELKGAIIRDVRYDFAEDEMRLDFWDISPVFVEFRRIY